MCFIFHYINRSYSQSSYLVIIFGSGVIYVRLSYWVLLTFSDTTHTQTQTHTHTHTHIYIYIYILLTPHIFPWQRDEITLLSYWCYLSVYRSASKSSPKSVNTVNWIEGIYIYIYIYIYTYIHIYTGIFSEQHIGFINSVNGMRTLESGQPHALWLQTNLTFLWLKHAPSYEKRTTGWICVCVCVLFSLFSFCRLRPVQPTQSSLIATRIRPTRLVWKLNLKGILIKITFYLRHRHDFSYTRYGYHFLYKGEKVTAILNIAWLTYCFC